MKNAKCDQAIQYRFACYNPLVRWDEALQLFEPVENDYELGVPGVRHQKEGKKVAWTGHTGPRGAGRIAKLAGAKKLALTHLGPYDSTPAAIDMASMYYGPRRGPEIWSKILGEAKEEFDGPIVIGEDAMVLPISKGE